MSAIVALAAAAILVPACPAQAVSSVRFYKIYYDSPGTDTRSNTSLNGEYIVVKNYGTTARTLTGWTIRDAANHVYKFGTFRLGAGKTVTVRTGRGTNTSTTRYWGSGNYIWNNDTDRATLKSATGVAVAACSYNSTRVDYKWC